MDHRNKFALINKQQLADKAIEFLDNGKLQESKRLLQQMLLTDSNCLTAHFNLARVYRRTKNYRRALHHARRTLQLNPREANASLNLGLIYDILGRHKLAVKYYKRELARDPYNAATLWNLGRLYFKRRRWLAASRCLRRRFEMGFDSEEEDTVDKLGFCYDKLNDSNSYIELLTRYVVSKPNAGWAFANLGLALFYKKDYKGAALKLARATELGVKSVAAELARARKILYNRKPVIS